MSRRKKPTSPGCIFQRGKKLYIKYGNKQYSTGLNASKDGWEKEELIKDGMHDEYLRNRQMLPTISKTMTAYEAFEEFLAHLERKSISKNTKRSYILAMKSIVPNNCPLQIRFIKNAVNDFIESRGDISATSTNIYLRELQIFLNWCIRKEYISTINIYSENRRNVPNKEVVPYTDDEFSYIVSEIENHNNGNSDHEFALLLQFMKNTGSRIKETLELSWDDVDFKKSIIKFPNKINKTKIDYFPIIKPIEKILKELYSLSQNRLGSDKIKKVFRWEPSSTSRLTRRLSEIEESLGIKIKGQSFHRFRNTFSNNIIDANLPLIQVKDLMRHKDIRTTLTHYKKYDITKLKVALESIQQ